MVVACAMATNDRACRHIGLCRCGQAKPGGEGSMTQSSTAATAPVRRDAAGRIGIALQGFDPATAVNLIVEAEQAGIGAAWMTTGAIQADALTLFAGAAVRTERILLGSAIIPTWPRNPVFIAQQVQALEGLAPGRLRLGIGPSTAAAMRPFGVDFKTPLSQLEEYLRVLRSLLHEGAVDFTGQL